MPQNPDKRWWEERADKCAMRCLFAITEEEHTTALTELKSFIAEVEEETVKKYKAYLDFIYEANKAPISIAFAHGWECPEEDIIKGEEMRKELGIPPNQ